MDNARKWDKCKRSRQRKEGFEEKNVVCLLFFPHEFKSLDKVLSLKQLFAQNLLYTALI